MITWINENVTSSKGWNGYGIEIKARGETILAEVYSDKRTRSFIAVRFSEGVHILVHSPTDIVGQLPNEEYFVISRQETSEGDRVLITNFPMNSRAYSFRARRNRLSHIEKI